MATIKVKVNAIQNDSGSSSGKTLTRLKINSILDGEKNLLKFSDPRVSPQIKP